MARPVVAFQADLGLGAVHQVRRMAGARINEHAPMLLSDNRGLLGPIMAIVLPAVNRHACDLGRGEPLKWCASGAGDDE